MKALAVLKKFLSYSDRTSGLWFTETCERLYT